VEATAADLYEEYTWADRADGKTLGEFTFHVTRQRGRKGRARTCRARFSAEATKTLTLYTTAGDFLSARRFQETVGIDPLRDARQWATRHQPRSILFRSGPAHDRAERPAGRLSSQLCHANHFRGRRDSEPGAHAGVERTSATRKGSTIYPTADDEQRRLCRLPGAPRRDFPDDSFSGGPFGDQSTPWISTQILDLASTKPRSRAGSSASRSG